MSALARFYSFVVRDGDCWLWTGGRTSRGYPTLWVDGKTRRAHRFAYEQFVGPIPKGLVLDHACRNRICVNPAHLEPVTNRENILRGNGPTAANARKTHCQHGHALSGNNLSVDRRGCRSCRTCKAVYQRARAQARDEGRGEAAINHHGSAVRPVPSQTEQEAA